MTVEPRDIALLYLYESEQRQSVDVDLTGVSPKAARMITGVLGNKTELDQSIAAVSEHWTPDRMPPVDLTVLRIGLYELRFEPEVPSAVIISEAVRLAKAYSTERSGFFVNGVLGRLAEQERSDSP